MTSTILVGSTGLVGRTILELLTNLSTISSTTTISRRSPAPLPKVNAFVSTGTSTWPSSISTIPSSPKIYFSALGTTARAAGSIAAQRAIDLDLTLALAKEAQQSGINVCVLISSAGSSATARLPYPKMKGELEDAVKTLGFETTVILRPGLIIGKPRQDRSMGQYIAGNVAGAMGMLKTSLKDMWAQDADVIARAAVKSGVMALEGKAPSKIWVLGQDDIVRLGKGA